MLKYLIAVTEALISTAALLGLLYAATGRVHGQKGRVALFVGTLAGVVAAAIVAALKNMTSLVHTGVWNVRTFTVSLIALGLFAVLSLKPVRRKLGARGDWGAVCAVAVLAFTLVLYAMPDVLAYPFTISLNGSPILSTFYLYRLIGWLFGMALVIVTFFAIENTARRLDSAAATLALSGAALVNALLQLSKILQVLVTRRVLRGHTLFVIARYTSNYSDLFIYAVLLIAAAVPVSLWIAGLRAKEPYANPAQHRKIRAKRRDERRWSVTTLVCFALAVLCMTWLTDISARTVELSPIEDSELRGDSVYVALSQVEDGRLHRFAYTTPNGKIVRFIIIQKPNSSAYGIGLDACEICGETGYYERDGQVVCKLCDVVMNINTIGFKGGCNPIPIDYSVGNGYIVVPVSTLIEHENEFK